MRPGWLPGLVVLAAVLGLAPAALGARNEERIFLDRQTGRRPEDRIRAYVSSTLPERGRPGGNGYATARVVNPEREAHRVEIELRAYSGEPPHLLRRAVEVPAGDARTVHLPVPLLEQGSWHTLRFRLDGESAPERPRDLHALDEDGDSVLALDTRVFSRNHAWTAALERARFPSLGTVCWRDVADLPDRWSLLTGFAAVLVDESHPGLDEGRRTTLLRYVAAGGGLIVLNASEAEDGLVSRFSGAEESHDGGRIRTGRHGFGRWVAVSDAEPAAVPTRWICDRGESPFGGGIPPALWLPLEIPGLGEVPVRAFFLLILLFAVLVGPVSYVGLRRRRKRAWLLVTVPVSGLVCTAAILLYGFFSEGFGIQGTLRTVTVLDQRNHEAVTVAGRTLYAGLRPDAITPGADTLFSSLHFQDTSEAFHATRLDVDLGTGRVDGTALPSRTPIAFVTATAGRARERLRFRRLESDGYEPLVGPDFAPVDGRESIVLRAPDGTYYVSDGTGRLARTELDVAARMMRRLAWALSDMPVADPAEPRGAMRYISIGDEVFSWPDQARRTGPLALAGWVDRWMGFQLEPGTYLARVERWPALDDLGLEVEVIDGRHLVLGILAEDDILE